MKLFFSYALAAISIALLISCRNHSTHAKALFKEVETIVEQYPDSALHLLDSIQNPYELNEEQFAQYLICSLQAKTKAGKDIAADTLIFRVRDYYQKKKQQQKLVIAEFYSGRVLQSQEKQDEAMQAFLKARNLADKTGDMYWSGMADFYIGYLNYKQYLCKEARPYFKSSKQKMSTIKGKYTNEIIACNNIANTFLLDQPQAIDSTLFYERISLEIAKQNNDLIQEIRVNQCIGSTLLESGKISDAKETLKHALSLSHQTRNNNSLAKIYGCLADVYQEENKTDSALYYAELALMSTEDNDYKSVLYDILSEIEASRGNYQKSLEYLNIYADYADSLYNQKQRHNILEIQKKYNFELIQSANQKLMIEKLWTAVALIVSVLFIIIALFYMYRKRAMDKEALFVAKQQISQLKEMITQKGNEVNDINQKLRDALYEQLDIIKKVVLLDSIWGNNAKLTGQAVLKKVNEIIYKSDEEFDWSAMYQSLNALHDNYVIRLKNKFPDLSDSEVLVCCLLKIGFSNEEIGLLLKYSSNFAQKKKTQIREKTGMKKQENFIKLLDELIKTED